MKRAKIVCTIGPASAAEKTIASLIQSGMDVARLNFSHGTHAEHKRSILGIRKLSRVLNKPVAVLQDLQGVKIRIGTVENGLIHLKTGGDIIIREGDGVSSDSRLHIRYPGLMKYLKKDDRVLIDDGLILLRVFGKKRGGMTARIVEGGKLTDKKGVNLPDTRIGRASFTPKDKKDLDFGIETNVDYAAVSFVRSASDIEKVKRHIRNKGAEIPVIAKIEKPEALENIDAILKAADGIMIARGDLGVEMNTEDVPIIQKDLIKKANRHGKIVITATQMLESMTEHLRPTRAEATDVANAVIDGTDALMLSAETASGRYPVGTVKMMNRIIERAESGSDTGTPRGMDGMGDMDYPYAVADAAVRASLDIGAKAIVAFTHSGYTARLVSKLRPSVPIISFATSHVVQRRLSLLWGVNPLFMKPLSHTDEMIEEVERFLVRRNYVKKGDTITVIASSPLSISGRTNFMKLHTIK